MRGIVKRMDDEKFSKSTVIAAADILFSAVFIISAVFGSVSGDFALRKSIITHSMLAAGCFILGLIYLIISFGYGGKLKYLMLTVNISQILWVILVYAPVLSII